MPTPSSTQALSPEIQEFYDLQAELQQMNAEAGATMQEIQALERDQGQHQYAQRTAEGEERQERGTAEGLQRQLDQLRRQIDEGWRQLKTFADQIFRKEEMQDFNWFWARKSVQDHFINWLAISIGEKANDGRKIMARIFKIMFLRDASALRGASTPTMNVEPLELGALATIQPFPTEMYQRALQGDNELETDRAKYDDEVARLTRQEENVESDAREVQEHERKQVEQKRGSLREERLTEETQSQLTALRSRLDGERQKLRQIEARMNQIKREQNYNPIGGAGA